MKLVIVIMGLSLSILSFGQSSDVIIYESFDEFEHLLKKEDDKIHVINFWATWCTPCIKEMPNFEQLQEKYPDKVDVIFVSLDFRNQYESRLIPFLKKRDIKSNVVMLGDPKVNNWIDKVDPSWSGAIPASYFYKGKQKRFQEKEYHSLIELEQELSELFNQ